MPKQITGDEPAMILTIRQEFAARAMQGLLSDVSMSMDSTIRTAVKIADALIAELNKEV